MRKIIATPREADVLNALCELGQTDLVSTKLKITHKTVEAHILNCMNKNGHPNRLTLALAWDRQQRTRHERPH